MAGMSPRIKAKKGIFGAYGIPPSIKFTTIVSTATASVAFAVVATVSDDDNNALAAIVWTSDLDGSVGADGATSSLTLTTVGTHRITAAVIEGSPSTQRTGSNGFTVVVTA